MAVVLQYLLLAGWERYNTSVRKTATSKFWCTYDGVLAPMGRLDKKARKLTAVWQIKTACSASAYESDAALRMCGSSVGMTDAVCLPISRQLRPFDARLALTEWRVSPEF